MKVWSPWAVASPATSRSDRNRSLYVHLEAAHGLGDDLEGPPGPVSCAVISAVVGMCRTVVGGVRCPLMPHDRRFRFGADLSGPLPGLSWADTVRRIEDLGFTTVFLPDHFDEQYGPFTALAAAATVSSTITLGTLVLDNDYRHPVLTAKEVATLDVLSEGRVELGVGAGWKKLDYDQSGIPYDKPKVRVDRMIEGVEVMRRAFAEGPFDFTGEHYTISAYDGLPKPHRPGGPPLLIGGGGPACCGGPAPTPTSWA